MASKRCLTFDGLCRRFARGIAATKIHVFLLIILIEGK